MSRAMLYPTARYRSSSIGKMSRLPELFDTSINLTQCQRPVCLLFTNAFDPKWHSSNNVGTILDDRLHHLGRAPLLGLGHHLLSNSLGLLVRESARRSEPAGTSNGRIQVLGGIEKDDSVR